MSLGNATQRLTMYGSEVAWNVHAIEAQLEMVTRLRKGRSLSIATPIRSTPNQGNLLLSELEHAETTQREGVLMKQLAA
jgi:hypothetical protein